MHWLNIYRSWEENALGVKEFKWERTGPDHWVHASIYARIGLKKFARTMATIVGDDVMSGMRGGQIIRDEGVSLGYSPEQMAAQRVEL